MHARISGYEDSRVFHDSTPFGPARQLNIEIPSVIQDRLARRGALPFALGEIAHRRVLTGDVQWNISAVLQVGPDCASMRVSACMMHHVSDGATDVVLTVAVLDKIVLGEVALLCRLDCPQNMSLSPHYEREWKDIRHRSVSPTKSPLFNPVSIYSRPHYSRRVILSPACECHRVAAPGHVHVGAEVVRAGLALRGVLDGTIDGGLLTGGNRNRVCRRPEHQGGQGQGKREAHICSTSSESAVEVVEANLHC